MDSFFGVNNLQAADRRRLAEWGSRHRYRAIRAGFIASSSSAAPPRLSQFSERAELYNFRARFVLHGNVAGRRVEGIACS